MSLAELFGHLLTHELRLEQQATSHDFGIPTSNVAACSFSNLRGSTHNSPSHFSRGVTQFGGVLVDGGVVIVVASLLLLIFLPT